MAKIKEVLSPEDKLLKLCAQVELSEKIKDGLKEVFCHNLNWLYILEESKKEGIASLLYHNLLQFKDDVPENIWNDFKEIYYLNAYRNTKISQGINIVLSSFNKEGLKAILLKGIFLAEKIYNNIALRGTTDVDLLIKKEDLPRVDKLLEDLKYGSPIRKELRPLAIEKSYMNSMDYLIPDRHLPTLHIHWHIVNVSLPTYFYTKNIRMHRFWEDARPVKIQDKDTLQLSPHHLIIYLAEHALKHSFDRLILLSDINESIKRYKEQIHWGELIKEAKELCMERQLFYGLYFTKFFLDADIPQGILSEITPKSLSLLEKRFFCAVSKNIRGTKLCYFVYLHMVKGVINKLRFIFRTLFPPPSVLLLFFNLNKPKVTIKDYLLFLKKRFFHLKRVSSFIKI